MTTVIVFAFEPVPELEGRSGVCVVTEALGARLIEEGRAEDLEAHRSDSMRYVTGSAANLDAAAALRESRDTRGLVSVRSVKAKGKPVRTARLER